MRTLIVGAGEVGFNIAARLVDEGHDVMIIDRDEARLRRATDSLDLQGLRGHGAQPSVLLEAGIEAADMVVAVTDIDEVNMVACLSASVLGNPDIIKIARVRDPGYTDRRFLQDGRLDIDLVLNPERACADQVLTLLNYPDATDILDFAEGRVQLVGVRIGPTSRLAGMRFVDLPERFDRRVLIAALHRGVDVIIPRGDDVLLPGDEAYVVVPTHRAAQLFEALGLPIRASQRVLIAGGTRIATFLAADLAARGCTTKLIEPDAERAAQLAEELPGVVVLHGSPTDASLLREENVGEMNAFIATTPSEETNVMAGLLAQRLGAPRVVATVDRTEYQPLAKAIGIDVCISPRLTAVSSILHFIRRGRAVASRSLGEHETAEAIEFEMQLTSEIVGVPIRDLRLPRGALIACILRGAEVIVPSGDASMEAGDHILMVVTMQALERVERMVARRLDR